MYSCVYTCACMYKLNFIFMYVYETYDTIHEILLMIVHM